MKRYPPDGYFHAPDGFFIEPANDPCTCDEHCETPCEGETDCECQAYSLKSVVYHHGGSVYPTE